MEEIRNIFNTYAHKEKDIKAFILNITKIILKTNQLTSYFEGFGKLYAKNEEIAYDYQRRKILFNHELIIDNAINCMRSIEIKNNELYPFLYAYIADILFFKFQEMKSFYELEKGLRNLNTNIFRSLNTQVNDLKVDAFIKEDFQEFYNNIYALHPVIRSNFYYSLGQTLKMLKGLGYNDIFSFFYNDYYDILINTYDNGISPFEIVMQLYNYETYSSDAIKNDIIKKEFLDFKALEFYDADKEIMLKKILQYPLETRFKYGLPITTCERETLKLKLTCLKEI